MNWAPKMEKDQIIRITSKLWAKEPEVWLRIWERHGFNSTSSVKCTWILEVCQLQSWILATRCDAAKSKQDHRRPWICSLSLVFCSVKIQGTSRPKRGKPAEFLSWTLESHSQLHNQTFETRWSKKQGFSSQIDSKTLQKQTQQNKGCKNCDSTQSPQILYFLQPRHTFKLAQYTRTGHYALGHHETVLGFEAGCWDLLSSG